MNLNHLFKDHIFIVSIGSVYIICIVLYAYTNNRLFIVFTSLLTISLIILFATMKPSHSSTVTIQPSSNQTYKPIHTSHNTEPIVTKAVQTFDPTNSTPPPPLPYPSPPKMSTTTWTPFATNYGDVSKTCQIYFQNPINDGTQCKSIYTNKICNIGSTTTPTCAPPIYMPRIYVLNSYPILKLWRENQPQFNKTNIGAFIYDRTRSSDLYSQLGIGNNPSVDHNLPLFGPDENAVFTTFEENDLETPYLLFIKSFKVVFEGGFENVYSLHTGCNSLCGQFDITDENASWDSTQSSPPTASTTTKYKYRPDTSGSIYKNNVIQTIYGSHIIQFEYYKEKQLFILYTPGKTPCPTGNTSYSLQFKSDVIKGINICVAKILQMTIDDTTLYVLFENNQINQIDLENIPSTLPTPISITIPSSTTFPAYCPTTGKESIGGRRTSIDCSKHVVQNQIIYIQYCNGYLFYALESGELLYTQYSPQSATPAPGLSSYIITKDKVPKGGISSFQVVQASVDAKDFIIYVMQKKYIQESINVKRYTTDTNSKIIRGGTVENNGGGGIYIYRVQISDVLSITHIGFLYQWDLGGLMNTNVMEDLTPETFLNHSLKFQVIPHYVDDDVIIKECYYDIYTDKVITEFIPEHNVIKGSIKNKECIFDAYSTSSGQSFYKNPVTIFDRSIRALTDSQYESLHSKENNTNWPCNLTAPNYVIPDQSARTDIDKSISVTINNLIDTFPLDGSVGLGTGYPYKAEFKYIHHYPIAKINNKKITNRITGSRTEEKKYFCSNLATDVNISYTSPYPNNLQSINNTKFCNIHPDANTEYELASYKQMSTNGLSTTKRDVGVPTIHMMADRLTCINKPGLIHYHWHDWGWWTSFSDHIKDDGDKVCGNGYGDPSNSTYSCGDAWAQTEDGAWAWSLNSFQGGGGGGPITNPKFNLEPCMLQPSTPIDGLYYETSGWGAYCRSPFNSKIGSKANSKTKNMDGAYSCDADNSEKGNILQGPESWANQASWFGQVDSNPVAKIFYDAAELNQVPLIDNYTDSAQLLHEDNNIGNSFNQMVCPPSHPYLRAINDRYHRSATPNPLDVCTTLYKPGLAGTYEDEKGSSRGSLIFPQTDNDPAFSTDYGFATADQYGLSIQKNNDTMYGCFADNAYTDTILSPTLDIPGETTPKLLKHITNPGNPISNQKCRQTIIKSMIEYNNSTPFGIRSNNGEITEDDKKNCWDSLISGDNVIDSQSGSLPLGGITACCGLGQQGTMRGADMGNVSGSKKGFVCGASNFDANSADQLMAGYICDYMGVTPGDDNTDSSAGLVNRYIVAGGSQDTVFEQTLRNLAKATTGPTGKTILQDKYDILAAMYDNIPNSLGDASIRYTFTNKGFDDDEGRPVGECCYASSSLVTNLKHKYDVAYPPSFLCRPIPVDLPANSPTWYNGWVVVEPNTGESYGGHEIFNRKEKWYSYGSILHRDEDMNGGVYSRMIMEHDGTYARGYEIPIDSIMWNVQHGFDIEKIKSAFTSPTRNPTTCVYPKDSMDVKNWDTNVCTGI